MQQAIGLVAMNKAIEIGMNGQCLKQYVSRRNIVTVTGTPNKQIQVKVLEGHF